MKDPRDRSGKTLESWKKKKQKQMERVNNSMDAFRMGCAYTPGFEQYHELLNWALTRWTKTINKWAKEKE